MHLLDFVGIVISKFGGKNSGNVAYFAIAGCIAFQTQLKRPLQQASPPCSALPASATFALLVSFSAI